MITDGKKWHYLAMKSFSALFRGITSNHSGDFYCLNCFHLYSTKEKLKKHEKVCNNHDYCYVGHKGQRLSTMYFLRKYQHLTKK